MKVDAKRKRGWISPVAGAALSALCGLVLWKAPVGEPWVNGSYDYLFRFGSHGGTNNIVVILMDNEAFDHFKQVRGQPWDRALHAELLRRLAADGCALVVFDSFFRKPNEPEKDKALAEAMREQQHVVLMAEQAAVTHPVLAGAHPTLPCEPFFSASGTNWGVAWLDPDTDSIVRRHWPFPAPGPYPSLPETAARLAGVALDSAVSGRWLRYYGPSVAWTTLSYRFALAQPTNYFRGKVVFVGAQPKTSVPGDEPDEFRTPYSRWTGESTGGVEIMVTAFLNLVNGEWLRRPAPWLEVLLFLAVGASLGGWLCRMRLLKAGLVAAVFTLVVALGAVSWSYFTNYWFPWLVIAGGQVPCAFAWALATRRIGAVETVGGLHQPSLPLRGAVGARATAEPVHVLPDTPDYELFNPPFGQGAYGRVWLARNAAKRWQALKVVYRSSFGGDADPYEREFRGIEKYKPLSDQHPGLLRVDFVSEKKPEGYFYYVMDLGDSLETGWEENPPAYRPRELVSEWSRKSGQKLPVSECLNIGLALADALDFLHQHGLTHRDIKPQNVIFVNGRPKLADMGLIAEIRPLEQKRTYVGTPGYMPPPPEPPGTPQADIYALGMMLYVLSTGRNPTFFPELSTTLVDSKGMPEFMLLNAVILKACHPDCRQRYASAAEMHRALLETQQALAAQTVGKVPGSGQ